MFKIVVLIATMLQEPYAYGISDKAYPTQAECQKHVAGAIYAAKRDLPGNLYKGACLSVEDIDKIVAAAKSEETI